MKRFKNIIYLLWVVILIASCREKDENQGYQSMDNESVTNISAQPFPSGYGYLQDTTQLSKAVVNGDLNYVREHAWKIWAGIMQPSPDINWPLWYTWPNTKPAFAKAKSNMLSSELPDTKSLIEFNQQNIIFDTLFAKLLPKYPIPDSVKKYYGSDFSIGDHFLFNGDILIPTESISEKGFDWIRNSKVYLQSTLDSLHNAKVASINAPQDYIVTKHMYWPVLKNGLSAIPVWNDDYPQDYPKYAGYEVWNTLVAVDPSGEQVGQTADVTYLYGVNDADGSPINPITKNAKIYGLDDFYYHQVDSSDWASFDNADRAILNASSYWAYNKPFGIGDYLVTVAMHVNTKEIPTWALQSVWWSTNNDSTMNKYARSKPELPGAIGPWGKYNLTTGYGMIDPGTGELPMSMNPYIELVIHPVATNCNNCHIRAGWPKGNIAGKASYQNPDCPDLLAKLNEADSCLQKILLTDFQWIISDHAVKDN